MDLLDENLLPLTAIAKTVPNKSGKSGVSVATVWRWATLGCRGILLETACIGGRRMTSQAALRRFFLELSESRREGQTSDERRAQIEAANRALDLLN